MYLCVRGIDFTSLYDFAIGFGTALTVWYIFSFILLLVLTDLFLYIHTV
jgi:hypothetical protein